METKCCESPANAPLVPGLGGQGTILTGALIYDTINLLLENVLNGEYAQRLADVIYIKVKTMTLILRANHETNVRLAFRNY